MNARRFLRCIAALGSAAALGACQQKNTADEAAATSTSGVPAGIERFLLFPNPVGPSGAFETDSDAYASAYYRAIDPNNDKDTLDKWKTANSFGSGTGTEHLVVFKDEKDLGYGRRMTGRRNADGTIAFFVENYNVTSGSNADYSSSLNVEAAIVRDTRWHVGTNAIEWSAATCVAGVDPANCDPTARFAKFYNFSSADGTRQKFVNLDGKGMKAMPGPCITCHGGRGDPLTPADAGSGLPRFPLVENSVSRKRGDVQARMHGMNVGSFSYSAQPTWTRADQEASLKDFNQWMACTYPTPVPGATVTGSWGTCTRPTAGANEWQGTAFELIEAWYGGAGMPQGTFTDSYVPAGWSGNPGLYTNVVAPYCRTCHVLRGTGNQSDLDFTSLAKFQSYADRIKAHVFERGNMPLALIVYNDFWESPAPQLLAQYIDSVLGAGTVTSASGAALKPGRPIADPGPSRMVRTGANAILNGENSLFATSYSWSLVSGSATITYPNSAIAVFEAASPGQYTVRLTVGNGSGSNSKDVTITADDNFPDPLNIRFAQVKNVLQTITHTTSQVPAGNKCVLCHTTAGNPMPPVFYVDFDRDGSGMVDATDETWFVKALRGRANLTDIQASPLLRKPTGNHHNGLMLLDVSDTTSSGGLRNYSILYNWILAGMLPGGVASNAGTNSSNQLTFSGVPLYASVALDGSQSIGATSYLWTVVPPYGPNGPTGALPTITNPTSASATLNVPNVGTYVVRLLVSNGVFSDTSLRTITVTETPIMASFNPLAGSTPVTFSGNPLRGNITLDSTSAGNPQYCQWTANGPANATLEGISVPATVTTLCSINPTWIVPSGAIGETHDVTLTAFGIGSSSVTQGIQISDGTASVVASLANTATPQALTFSATGSNLTIPTYNDYITNTFAGNVVVPIVGASVSLNGSASTTPPATTLSYSWCVSTQPDQARFPASIAVCPATTSSGTSATTTMTARATGSYTVQLTVNNGLSSHSISKVVQVNPFRGVRFSDFTGTSNDGYFNSIGCSGCHFHGTPRYNPFSNNPNGSGFEPPQWENMTGADGTTLYERVRQRVNLGTPASSLLVLNPTNTTSVLNPIVGLNSTGHGGGCLPGFNIWGEAAFGAHGCPDTSQANYNNFLNWIQDGAPPGN